MEVFADRQEAGRRLAPLLERYREERPVVLALPRGGVPVGREVARALGAPLDVLVVRKIGAPIQPELGMGAVAEGGARFLDPRVVHAVSATDEEVEQIVAAESAEVQRRVARYRGGRTLPDLTGRTVLLVDDGIATGGTMRAGIRALRSLGAGKIVVAAPVAAAETARTLETEADEVVCLLTPEDLWAIGAWYVDFGQVSDEEVVALLEPVQREVGEELSMSMEPEGQEDLVRIQAGLVTLEGNLHVPEGARGIVLFAHGSGSSRFSPRNRFVAQVLAEAGLATLLLDLLTEDEEAQDAIDAHLRFDIPFLAERLGEATDWLLRQPATSHLRIGYFGSSTGAAAALVAAAERVGMIDAVVSRGGRPDLAGDALERVYAPTLLIVGGNDFGVIELNQSALAMLPGEKELTIVPGATHLFEEPGALDEVARLAAAWFVQHLARKEEAAYP
jgi:putative phosphoribosyl transferase